MKWFWMLLTNPVAALDWYDKSGQIDHGKVVADLVIGAVTVSDMIVSIRQNAFIPVAHVIVLVSGAMGARVFLAFLNSRTVTANETRLITEPLKRDIDDPDKTPAPDGGDGAAK